MYTTYLNLINKRTCYYVFSCTCDIREKREKPAVLTGRLQHKTQKKGKRNISNINENFTSKLLWPASTSNFHILKNWYWRDHSFNTDISDHFPIIYAFKLKTKLDIRKTQFLYKRFYINEDLIKAFKSGLRKISWEIIKSVKDPNESYKKFIAILSSINDEFFPKSRIKVRHNKNTTPWITRGIAKSSKRKQKLYEKFLKKRTSKNEMNYKNYRRLFKSVKRKSKNNLFTLNN